MENFGKTFKNELNFTKRNKIMRGKT